MRVLVVDDSKTMLRILTNVLLRLDIEDFVTAEDGKEGLERFKAQKFDLVLTDWNMPEMTGLEMVQEIRKTNRDVPIIMITTEGGKREVITALKAGVNNYIIKPFTPDILRQKLQETALF